MERDIFHRPHDSHSRIPMLLTTDQSRRHPIWKSIALRAAVAAMMVGIVGCGKTVQQAGTEQLLISDAVDRAIAKVDFSSMRDQKVFLDTQFVRNIKTVTIVNADYIVSGTRQQLLAAGCLLQESEDNADIVLEIRIGAIGNNAHELTYGIPANNSLGVASAALTGVPTIPTVPEISFARKNNYLAAAKVGYFAYDKHSREPIWQSGPQRGLSRAREYWVMGAGPFQSGEIFDGTMLAGNNLDASQRTGHLTAQEVSYWESHQFKQLQNRSGSDVDLGDEIQHAGHKETEGSPQTPGVLPTAPASPQAPKRKKFDPSVYRKPGGQVSQSEGEQDNKLDPAFADQSHASIN